MKLVHVAELCPTCGGELYRSHRRGLIEAVAMRLLLIRAYRCERCGQRFFIPPTVIFEGSRPVLQEDPDCRPTAHND